MAITITPVHRSPKGATRRGQRVCAFTVKGDASKPTGGYPITATKLDNLTAIDFVIVQTPDPLYNVKWLAATDSASGTLQWYRDTTGGTSLSALHTPATASETKISLSTVGLLVFGR